MRSGPLRDGTLSNKALLLQLGLLGSVEVKVTRREQWSVTGPPPGCISML